MSASSGELILGRYRIREKRAVTAAWAVFDAIDPRRPELRVRIVVSEASGAQAARMVEQTRRYALGTPELATAVAAGEIALPGEGKLGAPRGVALAFELGTGRTLDELTGTTDGLDVRRALCIIQNAARALAVLHDQGIGHGLVLPALIAIDPQERVTLGGYGVAQLAGASATDPRADCAALGRLARELFARVLPPGIAQRAEIARWLDAATSSDSELLASASVRWAEALVSAVQGELSRSAVVPPLESAGPPAPPRPDPPEQAASGASRTPPAVAVASRPPAAGSLAQPARKGSGVGAWVIGGALGLALLLLFGVVVGLFAHSVWASKRAQTSGAASAASMTGGTGVPPPASPTAPPLPVEPAPAESAPPAPDPFLGVPEIARSPGAIRRGSAAIASDAEAALPLSPLTPAKAAPDALVTALMFGDLECGYTRRTYQTLSELERLFPGDLRIAWRHRPLREHGHARDAAVFAAALHAEQGASAFWRLVADVSKSDEPANREWLTRWASRQERAFAGFHPPTDTTAAAVRVDDDLALANRFAVRETPTVFINGLRVRGERSLDELRAVITRELQQSRALLGAGVQPSFIYSTRVTKNLIGIGPEILERACPPLEQSPRRGAARALVTLVVFSDFQCPFCRRAHPILKRLEAKYAGEMAIVWKNLPLAQHPNAASAARLALAARAAGGDSRFWAVHDLLFQADPALDRATLEAVARAAGLDARLIEAAVRGEHQAEIDADTALARRLGVTGTPTVFVNGRRLGGAQAFSSFEGLVREELQTAQRLLDRRVKRERLYSALCGEAE